MMGGTIGVSSVPGLGSTFSVSVRLGKPLAKGQALPRQDHGLQGLRVLIVDDNETNRSILHHQVMVWGMGDSSAESGPQGLEMLRAAAARGEPYDLAILDMHMPDMDGIALAQTIQADPTIASVRLVMLTSTGVYGDVEKARQSGIRAYLSKPVRQSQLYQCLTTAIEAPRTSSAARSSPPGAGVVQPALGGHVLLAEDNAVNRLVAVRMLERLGCQVEVTTNGREAVAALAHCSYDLVLMDCQMPEMDGFAATRMIRQRQAQAAQVRMPIIAITAHAMKGDREQCLAAGMDDYLSKPFTLEQLQAVLQRWLAPEAVLQPTPEPSVSPGAPGDEVGVGQAPPQTTTMDCQTLEDLRRLTEAPEVFRAVVHTYLQETPELLAALQTAVTRDDAAAVRLTAHSLKSSSATLGALALSALCAELEALGRTKVSGNAAAILSHMTTEYEAVKTALTSELERCIENP
jgi:CheY-like chemotaxis protein/HPt (histidine-containing phosphotransfer) domain-containing protein